MEEYENGITFTDEEAAEEVKKQLQDAEDALKYENTDADTIAKEFDGVASRCQNCIKKLDELYDGGSSYEAAESALAAFRYSDMHFMKGFIPLFSANKANKKLFESPAPNLSPDFIQAKTLYLDSVEFRPLFFDTGVMLTSLMDLESLFAFKMAYDNFKEAGYDKFVYDNYSAVFRELSQCFSSNGLPYELTPLSHHYYYENCKQMSDKEMAPTYWAFRKLDYNNWFKEAVKRVRGIMNGEGPFSPKGSVASTLQVIDKYTRAVYEHRDADTKIKELIDKSGELMKLSSTLVDKIKHPSSKNVLLTLSRLYKKLGEIASEALEHYNKFKDSDEAPYVYMKYPDHIRDGWFAKTNCGPQNGGGWDGGTKYYESIWRIADGISKHFEEEVYNQGFIKR
ncbi:MAG: hypothetical protein IKQ36_07180 [Clostridia bacterium]|nr:hypothetical protein [Clostridia bacterium]